MCSISRSMAFGMNSTQENLVQIRDPLVGNWQDSGSGLGYGIYPFEINCALVPFALRAIVQLPEAGIISSDCTVNATRLAEVWDTQAHQFFETSIDPTTASARSDEYVTRANLSQTLLYGAGALDDTQFGGNATDGTGWGANDQVGNTISASIIQATIEAIQPYLRGLLTDVGIVIANAAYDPNVTNIETFNYLQYHGAVSWSWPQGLMAAVIFKQLGLCGASINTQLEQVTSFDTLLSAQTRLWDSIEGSAPALYTEVLSPIYDPNNNTYTNGDLGAISPTGTEGDAIQLWSYGFLAQVDPRSGRAVAAGFATNAVCDGQI